MTLEVGNFRLFSCKLDASELRCSLRAYLPISSIHDVHETSVPSLSSFSHGLSS